MSDPLPKWAIILLRTARKRSRKLGVECGIDEAAVARLLKRAGGRCELTGIPFRFERAPMTHKRPFAPSLDRRDNWKGYTEDNLRLVAVCVNAALNEWGEVVFAELVRAVVVRYGPSADPVSDAAMLRRRRRLRFRLNEAQEDEIVEGYLAGGQKVAELGLPFGVKRRHVYKILERRGISRDRMAPRA